MLNEFFQMQQMMKKMGKFQKMVARMGARFTGNVAEVGLPHADVTWNV
jgi:signal recognition particle GTPase